MSEQVPGGTVQYRIQRRRNISSRTRRDGPFVCCFAEERLAAGDDGTGTTTQVSNNIEIHGGYQLNMKHKDGSDGEQSTEAQQPAARNAALKTPARVSFHRCSVSNLRSNTASTWAKPLTIPIHLAACCMYKSIDPSNILIIW